MDFRVRCERSQSADQLREAVQLTTRVVCVFVSHREMGGNAMHLNCLQTLNGCSSSNAFRSGQPIRPMPVSILKLTLPPAKFAASAALETVAM